MDLYIQNNISFFFLIRINVQKLKSLEFVYFNPLSFAIWYTEILKGG